MAITIGSLRTFCQEIASPDSSGATAGRERMIWINAALKRLYSELGWDEIQHEQKITLLPTETGSLLSLTQGSLSCTLSGAETFLDKYLDDRWDLLISGETRVVFRLGSIDDSPTNQQATLRAGDEWLLATGVKAYSVAKSIYPLPDNASIVHRVQIMGDRTDVRVLLPQVFDTRKAIDPTQTGVYPSHCCFRDGNIELWPNQGDNYVKIGLSFVKAAPTFADDALDAATVEWQEEWRDLLHKAILLEASVTQGENSPIDYRVTLNEYATRRDRYLKLASAKVSPSGPMGIRTPGSHGPYHRRSMSWREPLLEE